MNTYRTIADTLAAEIASGRLGPGDRLPPQRQFADERRIAVSTASRVYSELVRRGLVTGEVGRGTYVRAAPTVSGGALAEPAVAAVDLQLSFPMLPGQSAELARSLVELMRRGPFSRALGPVGPAATAEARALAAKLMARGGWTPDAESVLFTGNGRQAIAAVLAALAPTGARLGVEALTYPVVKPIAARLGITLVPLALDPEGVRPDALLKAHRTAPLRGVYLQPTLHNPLGITMGTARRTELASVIRKTGMIAVEDAIYSFLADDKPLAAFAPEHTIVVDSLSKRLAPGLSLGFIAGPARLTDQIATAVRSGAWSASGFPLAAGVQWMRDGTARRIGAAKRKDAVARQKLARTALAGMDLMGDPRAYHLWLRLPDTWRADAFVAAAARQRIAITAASAFAVGAGHAPNAVRLALASPPRETLAIALRTLRRLAALEMTDPDVE